MQRRTFLGAMLASVSLAVSVGFAGLRAAVSDVCSKVMPRRRGMPLPPLPKWNKATDDIDSADFMRRSQDFERSLLPRDIIFPRAGQIWEALRDCEVPIMASGNARGILSAKLRIQQGERVRILAMADAKPLYVRCQPVRCDELRDRIVPDECFKAFTYWHYELSLRLVRTPCCVGEQNGYFIELFRLVEDVG